jgi:pantoate kinase
MLGKVRCRIWVSLNIAAIGGDKTVDAFQVSQRYAHPAGFSDRNVLQEITSMMNNQHSESQATQHNTIVRSSPNKRTVNHYNLSGATFNFQDTASFTLH